MCGGTVGGWFGGGGGEGSLAKKMSQAIGQPDTAKTQIGDTGAAGAQRRKPRSLLSGAAIGDTSAAPIAVAGAKPTQGG